MARARNWEGLSTAQRQRYIGAGRSGATGDVLDANATREFYLRGGDLRALRGHVPARKPWAAPKEATIHESFGFADAGDVEQLRRWRKSNRGPKWIPASVPTDVAAVLSQLSRGPARWKSVTISPIEGTGRYRMVVEYKGGAYSENVVLADWDSTQEVGVMLNDYARIDAAQSPRERKRLEKEWSTPAGRALHIAVNINGTDPRARSKEGPLPKGNGRALPRKSPTKKGTK